MDICDICTMGELELIIPNNNYEAEHYKCNVCGSVVEAEIEVIFEPDFDFE